MKKYTEAPSDLDKHEVPMKPEYAAMLPGERAIVLRELHEQSERRRLGLE